MVVSMVAMTGPQLEKEALEASLMRRMSHSSRPSSFPNTTCWLPLSDFESPTCELVHPFMQIANHCLYADNSFANYKPHVAT